MALFDFFSAKSLEDAVQRNSIRSARRLLEKGLPQAKLNECLYLAVHAGVEMIDLLLQYGADVNQPYSFGGRTPLHLAASQGYVDVVKFLLEHGARTDIADSDGKTPLAATLQSPHEDMSWALGMRPTVHDEGESERRRQAANLIKAYERAPAAPAHKYPRGTADQVLQTAGSHFGYGRPDHYHNLIRTHLSTSLPVGLSGTCYERHTTPPDLTFSTKDRDREQQRRLVYHQILSIPGDKQADVKWARNYTESILTEVASYGKGVMMAYALVDSWRQLLFISHLPDDNAPDWEKNAPNTPYLAWSRMQLSLNMLVVPNQSLSNLLREELQKAQTLTGRLGSYNRRTLGSNLNMARLVCLLAELEDLGSALEEVIVHWKKELAADI